MQKGESNRRNIRRHIIADYGLSFKAMTGMLKNDPLELLYRLNSIDEAKIEAKRAKRKARKKHKKSTNTTNVGTSLLEDSA